MTSVKDIGMERPQRNHLHCCDQQRGEGADGIIETKASTIVQFFSGLQGDLRVTFEEGTWAAWLYDLRNHTSATSMHCTATVTLTLWKKGARFDPEQLKSH